MHCDASHLRTDGSGDAVQGKSIWCSAFGLKKTKRKQHVDRGEGAEDQTTDPKICATATQVVATLTEVTVAVVFPYAQKT